MILSSEYHPVNRHPGYLRMIARILHRSTISFSWINLVVIGDSPIESTLVITSINLGSLFIFSQMIFIRMLSCVSTLSSSIYVLSSSALYLCSIVFHNRLLSIGHNTNLLSLLLGNTIYNRSNLGFISVLFVSYLYAQSITAFNLENSGIGLTY